MAQDKEKTLEEVIKLLALQEEILQFTHFTNGDAWELGSFMVAEAKKRELPVAISIRRHNGEVIFQYCNDGTDLTNADWMRRKENTVKAVSTSSLRLYVKLQLKGETMADIFLDERDHACCGGGFPIRIEEAGVIGTIIVSGLNHVADHDFIVKCLSKYLHTDEVPRIREMN